MKKLHQSDLPCWLCPSDKEIARALLEIDWVWLDGEEPDSWKDKAWEYKVGRHRGWQFWATPGECSLLVVRQGAVFGLPLEGRPELDFEGELHKAKAVISEVQAQQKLAQPKQLCLWS